MSGCPRSGLKVPNLRSAAAMAQRSAAQKGHHSAPMYSISGLPPEVSAGPVTGFSACVLELPMPTWASTLAGTARLACTLAGRVPLVPPACWALLPLLRA